MMPWKLLYSPLSMLKRLRQCSWTCRGSEEDGEEDGEEEGRVQIPDNTDHQYIWTVGWVTSTSRVCVGSV